MKKIYFIMFEPKFTNCEKNAKKLGLSFRGSLYNLRNWL